MYICVLYECIYLKKINKWNFIYLFKSLLIIHWQTNTCINCCILFRNYLFNNDRLLQGNTS